jgi:hypothetical protein
MRKLLPTLMLVLPGLSLGAAEPGLSVGFGSVDVSPELGKKPVYLAGFGQDRPATRIHDPIMARAVVLADGSEKIALVSVDVVGLFLPSVDRIRSGLNGYRYVLVSSTHNHEAPDTLGLWGRNPFVSGIDPDYLKRVEDGAAAAVRKADAARKPAIARIGTSRAPELLHDGRDPQIKHDELVALRFEEATGTPIGILVQWNCHPETLGGSNTEVSADYVHYTIQYLTGVHRCPVAYFTGTVGGLMTSLHVKIQDAAGKEVPEESFAKTERFGNLVGEHADRALKSSVPVTLTPFSVRHRSFLVPVDNGLYRVAKKTNVLNRPMYVWSGDPFPKTLTETEDVTKPVAIKSEVGYLKLGELEVAAIPGEIYPESVLGRVQDPADPGADFPDAAVEPAVYDQMKAGKHRMIIGLANDEIGYFIPKRQWDEKPPFCYGRKKSQYGEVNSVGPEAAPIICNLFKNLAAGK